MSASKKTTKGGARRKVSARKGRAEGRVSSGKPKAFDPPRRSKGHVCFAKGELDSRAGLRAVSSRHDGKTAEPVEDCDWELFADRHGVTLYRARVGGEVLVPGGPDGRRDELAEVRLALRKGDFMGRVRQPAVAVAGGPEQVSEACERLRVQMPESTRARLSERVARAEWAGRRTGAVTRERGATGAPAPRAPSDESEMPEGWSMEIRETAKGRKYKVYTSPNGKNFQSFKKAMEYHAANLPGTVLVDGDGEE